MAGRSGLLRLDLGKLVYLPIPPLWKERWPARGRRAQVDQVISPEDRRAALPRNWNSGGRADAKLLLFGKDLNHFFRKEPPTNGDK